MSSEPFACSASLESRVAPRLLAVDAVLGQANATNASGLAPLPSSSSVIPSWLSLEAPVTDRADHLLESPVSVLRLEAEPGRSGLHPRESSCRAPTEDLMRHSLVVAGCARHGVTGYWCRPQPMAGSVFLRRWEVGRHSAAYARADRLGGHDPWLWRHGAAETADRSRDQRQRCRQPPQHGAGRGDQLHRHLD